ncbi:iron-containing alcohol dehydrogenase [Pseudarthrobacter enclensis]|uniref:Glycerol-1-phosphate dehydrogenase [NAD(P)+] n=1 Tax=Pseudarthrobacter enclensis TaxID=993070 RepID=A0ABT9RYH2_9MICC|nr:iron-containing alcohol dehydrogenase [Pseudarthrobacter enclensis]MDP9890297.1 glycerol-1-phosphate dehydrogenase [NAD(P)+] [Pseudarthrobacter enclensis]
MPTDTYAVEPIEELLAQADPDHTLARCGLRQLIIGPGAVGAVADAVRHLLPAPGNGSSRPRISLLVDGTRITRFGEDVKDLIEVQLAATFDVVRTVLDDGHAELHVVDSVLEEAAEAVLGMDAVVAVGGGTISDIAKVAVQRGAAAGSPPSLVSVQTAASVDGYTDDVSVVLRDGVKRTVPSCWPDAVISDTDVIAEAPAAMNRAGFGEMTSMLVAPADWRLASLVGTEPAFKPSAVRLLGMVGKDLESWSPGVREGRPDSVGALARALALRGIVTGVAGTTAVLSGVEHLISHMLDQYHGAHGQPIGFHGAQVGAGSVIAASAWDMLFERLAAAPLSQPRLATLELEGARNRVFSAFERVDPSLRVAEECWRDYSAKLHVVGRGLARVGMMLEGWAEVREELRSLVRPAGSIASALSEAGAAVSLSGLAPSVDAELGRWAVENCALMRNRFTVVDLLTLLGWWGAEDVEEVLERAAQAAAAADAGRK